MPIDAASNNKISYVEINSDSNYFNTDEQVKIRSTRTFADSSAPSAIVELSQATGLFSGKRMRRDPIYNSATYATSSTEIDPSGQPRPILALNVNYYASSSIDAYRQGIEIQNQAQWTNGLAKITSGEPGHLFQQYKYGYNDVSIIDSDTYYEVEVFDPIKFVETGGDPDLFQYPIITSDVNQKENYILNGIIEPFPIRPVISNFSINFPFEPHAFRGDYGNGNLNHRFASDQVLSIDYFEPSQKNAQMFLDAVDYISMYDSASTHVGVYIPYFLLDENIVPPFVDAILPRGQLSSAAYSNDLLDTVYKMLPGGTTYVTNKQHSATCGFVYKNSSAQGVDSIAFGGQLY